MKEGEEAPNIEPFLFYIEAFKELSSCRPSGFGISPIPFTAIVEYARIYEVEDFNDFLDSIRAMDEELINLESSKQKSSNVKANKKN